MSFLLLFLVLSNGRTNTKKHQQKHEAGWVWTKKDQQNWILWTTKVLFCLFFPSVTWKSTLFFPPKHVLAIGLCIHLEDDQGITWTYQRRTVVKNMTAGHSCLNDFAADSHSLSLLWWPLCLPSGSFHIRSRSLKQPWLLLLTFPLQSLCVLLSIGSPVLPDLSGAALWCGSHLLCWGGGGGHR